MRKRVKHFLKLGVAWLLLLVGAVLFVTPIPIGIFFIGAGLSLLIYSSETVQHKIHDFRDMHPKFNQRLVRVENMLEHRMSFISNTLRKTRPDNTDVK